MRDAVYVCAHGCDCAARSLPCKGKWRASLNVCVRTRARLASQSSASRRQARVRVRATGCSRVACPGHATFLLLLARPRKARRPSDDAAFRETARGQRGCWAHLPADGRWRAKTRLTRPRGEAAGARDSLRGTGRRARKRRTGGATSERGARWGPRGREARLARETRRTGEATSAGGERLWGPAAEAAIGGRGECCWGRTLLAARRARDGWGLHPECLPPPPCPRR